MSYYKKCICGYFSVYDKSGMAPMYCQKCGRQLLTISEESGSPLNDELQYENQNQDVAMFLECEMGIIPITEELIVGRNCYGKEFLKNYPTVSREQFAIKPRSSGIAAIITDKSSYSTTYLNGEKIGNGNSRIVTNGGIITLSNVISFKFIIKNRS